MNRLHFRLILTIFVALILAPAGSEGKHPQSPGNAAVEERLTWQEGSRRQEAVMVLDEVAVFPHEGTSTPLDEDALIGAFPSPARIAGRSDALIRLKLSLPLTHEKLMERLRTLNHMPSVGKACPVFYTGPGRALSSLRIPTGKLILRFADGIEREEMATMEEEYGITEAGSYAFSGRVRICSVSDPSLVIDTANRVHRDARVRYAYPCFYRFRALKTVPGDPLFEDQWHLKNEGTLGGIAGNDVNILSVWDDYRGSADEVIAIVDDGMETGHEDLTANVLSGLSYDFVSDDGDPTAGDHGTSCAGVAAGRGFNGIGITGAAPGAGLVGLRIMDDLGFLEDNDEAAALSHAPHLIDIYSNSWGPVDPLSLPEAMLPTTEEAIIEGITQGRNGLGNIYVWANGNGGEDDDNSNCDGYANSRYTIAVAASTDDGTRAPYSEKGAVILVNAPSSGGAADITTTDRSGSDGYNRTFFQAPSDYADRDYTGTFGGTSVTAPLVAGVIALMLEANPSLTWRDVQQILMITAEKNDPLDDDWTVNGAGFPVNHKYGFGRVDAGGAVDAALSWTPSGAEVFTERSSAPNLTIPDNSGDGVEDRITVDDDLVVEFVEVVFSAGDHPYWADLEIVLTSPDGTESILAERHVVPSFYGYGYESWKFGSVRHFGEGSRGDWILTVRDLAAEDSGTFQAWTLRIYGTADIHTVTARAGENGSIAPAGSVIVDHGSSQTFQITPDEGYRIETVVVDGEAVGTPSTYTFVAVTHDHTIVASFEPQPVTHTISASSGTGGSISPSGMIVLDEGTGQTFSLTADEGYRISDVIVDGESMGPADSYSFTDITADHTIEVLFEEETPVYTITATAGEGGTISPAGAVTVAEGADQGFVVTPDEGYRVRDIFVDGTPAGMQVSYTFYGVASDHWIEALFEAEDVPSDGGGSGGCFIGVAKFE